MNRLKRMAARVCVSAATAALVLAITSCSADNGVQSVALLSGDAL